MRRWSGRVERLVTDDGGSASVEFLAAGLILLLPLIYLVLVVASVHSAALATEGAARQGARVFARAATVEEGRARLNDAVAVTLADYGVRGEKQVAVGCSPDPADCLRRGGVVTVTVSTRVPLPLAPPVLDLRAPVSVPVSAQSRQPVSRFRVDG